MKMFLSFLIILFFADISTSAQHLEIKDGLAFDKSGKLFSGHVTSKYESGAIKEELEYFKGKKHGAFMIYDETGLLMEKGYFEDGEKSGAWKKWNTDGFLVSSVYFNNGQKDGKWQIWDEKGVLRYLMFYEAGEKVGNWKVFAENGNLLQEKDYTRAL